MSTENSESQPAVRLRAQVAAAYELADAWQSAADRLLQTANDQQTVGAAYAAALRAALDGAE